MADRFWTPGSAANWGDANVWATTKGGDPTGIATPTSADNVYFTDDDVNNCTIGAAANCLDLDFTGYTGTLAGSSNLSFYGSAVFDSAMTNSWTGALYFKGTTSETFTSDGVHFAGNLQVNGAGGTLTLQDDFYSTSTIALVNGTLDTNGYTVTMIGVTVAAIFKSPVLTLGSSTIVITGSSVYVWSVVEIGGTLTINAGTSTIKFTNAFEDTSFNMYGKTYNNIWLTGGGAGYFFVSGGGTINNFKVDTPPCEIYFQASKTVTISSWTGSGTAGNLVKIISNTTTNATLAKAGGGVISLDYMDVDYITGSPADTWYMGANSTDGTHNSQIYFTAAPSSTSIKTVFGIPIADIKTINGVAIADVKSWLGISNVD